MTRTEFEELLISKGIMPKNDTLTVDQAVNAVNSVLDRVVRSIKSFDDDSADACDIARIVEYMKILN